MSGQLRLERRAESSPPFQLNNLGQFTSVYICIAIFTKEILRQTVEPNVYKISQSKLQQEKTPAVNAFRLFCETVKIKLGNCKNFACILTFFMRDKSLSLTFAEASAKESCSTIPYAL